VRCTATPLCIFVTESCNSIKHHIHYILQMKGPLCERKFLTNNDLQTGVGNSVCNIPKTGTLLLWASYQIDGKGAQTMVGSMSKVLHCDLTPFISWKWVSIIYERPLYNCAFVGLSLSINLHMSSMKQCGNVWICLLWFRTGSRF
jgi:hypothetical protein